MKTSPIFFDHNGLNTRYRLREEIILPSPRLG